MSRGSIMAVVKLTQNFSLSEFTNGTITPYQQSLLQLLANNLQKVRDYLQQFKKDPKKNVCIGISSGVRTQADYDRLLKKGYNPSKTSDHFCGLQLLGKPTLGAADIYVTNCTLSYKEIAKKIIELNKNSLVDFGQIIYEYNPATKSEWIHLGNDWTKIFQDQGIIDAISKTRKKYLMSLDNGKTYIDFK